MKKLGIVICNYNKKEYVTQCIASVFEQDFKDFDIYVVDNASSDGSADALREAYGNDIFLICNEKNLGGSGGFNTGIRNAMKKDYEYIVLLDNDVRLRSDCLSHLFQCMNESQDIGIMGCKILKMDSPDIIQEFAPCINYETLTFELRHGGEPDNGQLPIIEDCGYVPACALIVRTKVIEEIGVMPEENFIYYDDIEWCVRCHEAGYRVVANSLATVWHKGGAGINPTTFSNYYILRNKIKFFTTYMQNEPTNAMPSREEIEYRAELILRDVYEGIYGCNYRGKKSISATRMDAFLDALNGITGRAKDYQIRKREETEDVFEKLLDQYDSVYIDIGCYWEAARRIVNQIRLYEKQNNRKLEIVLKSDNSFENNSILGIGIVNKWNVPEAALELHVCKHIYRQEMVSEDMKWIDGWGNLVVTSEDFESRKNYDGSYELFKVCFFDRVINLINANLGGQA